MKFITQLLVLFQFFCYSSTNFVTRNDDNPVKYHTCDTTFPRIPKLKTLVSQVWISCWMMGLASPIVWHRTLNSGQDSSKALRIANRTDIWLPFSLLFIPQRKTPWIKLARTNFVPWSIARWDVYYHWNELWDSFMVPNGKIKSNPVQLQNCMRPRFQEIAKIQPYLLVAHQYTQYLDHLFGKLYDDVHLSSSALLIIFVCLKNSYLFTLQICRGSNDGW